MAVGIGTPKSTTSTGTTTKPPPTPRNPVRKPTPRPPAVMRNACPVRRAGVPVEAPAVIAARAPELARVMARARASIPTAASNMTTAKQSSRAFGSTDRLSAVPTSEAGTPSSASRIPAPQRVWCDLAWLRLAVAAATPTITRLAVVASWADRPSR